MIFRRAHARPFAALFALWPAATLAVPSQAELFAMLAGQVTHAPSLVEAARQYDDAAGSQRNTCNAIALYERAAVQPAPDPSTQRAVATARQRLGALRSREWCELRWVGPPDAAKPLAQQLRAEFRPPAGPQQPSGRPIDATPGGAGPALATPAASAPAASVPVPAAASSVPPAAGSPALAGSLAPRPWPATGPAAFLGPTVVAPDERACRSLASQVAVEAGLVSLLAQLADFAYAAPDVQAKLQAVLQASERKARAVGTAPARFFEQRQVRDAQDRTIARLAQLQARLEAKGDFIARAQLRPIPLPLNAAEVRGGFHAEAYSTAGGGTLIVFRGTEFDSVPDWLANFANFVDLPYFRRLADDDSHQYRVALQVIRRLVAEGHAPGRIIATGHSLGGGLAAYAALTLGLEKAYAFNPAQIGHRNMQRERRLVPAPGGSQTPVLNVIASHPGLGADVAHQASGIARELVRVQLTQPSRAQLYGATVFVPIELDLQRLRDAAAGGVPAHRGAQAAAAVLQLHGIEQLAKAVGRQADRPSDIGCVLPADALALPAIAEAAGTRHPAAGPPADASAESGPGLRNTPAAAHAARGGMPPAAPPVRRAPDAGAPTGAPAPVRIDVLN